MTETGDNRCWIGLDLGTSGCRAIAIDPAAQPIAFAKADLPQRRTTKRETTSSRANTRAVEQDPEAWWCAVVGVLGTLIGDLHRYRPQALCVDGTSASILLCTPQGQPLTAALMYNDARAIAEAQLVAEQAPADSAARGPSASLAKLLHLRHQLEPKQPVLALHQADWIGGRLSGRFGDSDWNNALKLGYDPQRLSWPDWLLAMDLAPIQLPRCHAPGTDLGPIRSEVATEIGLPPDLRICAGTTDSTAATLAAGARAPGDAVTSLGSTLVLKLISNRAVSDAASGVYSHRIGNLWLVGGASNSGGAALRQHFDDDELSRLSTQIDPDQRTGLTYYPLPSRGERFPIADPNLAPRITPRPASDALFLAGLLEGIAEIERAGYQRLCELGAPAPVRVLSSGGGAQNPTWTAIRSRVLGLPVQAAQHREAAYGSALLARGDCSAAPEHHRPVDRRSSSVDLERHR
ncbi:FGGY-family carbohydrate kinase [Halochromatium sp.]